MKAVAGRPINQQGGTSDLDSSSFDECRGPGVGEGAAAQAVCARRALSMAARVFGRLGGARGFSLIEAALVLPLFLLLTFSIVDFGAMFYAYLSLENGVSVASRYAVTGQTVPGPGGG